MEIYRDINVGLLAHFVKAISMMLKACVYRTKFNFIN